jgi:hypothetical protein
VAFYHVWLKYIPYFTQTKKYPLIIFSLKVEDNVNINEGNIAEEIRAYRYLQADRAIPRAQKVYMY